MRQGTARGSRLFVLLFPATWAYLQGDLVPNNLSVLPGACVSIDFNFSSPSDSVLSYSEVATEQQCLFKHDGRSDSCSQLRVEDLLNARPPSDSSPFQSLTQGLTSMISKSAQGSLHIRNACPEPVALHLQVRKRRRNPPYLQQWLHHLSSKYTFHSWQRSSHGPRERKLQGQLPRAPALAPSMSINPTGVCCCNAAASNGTNACCCGSWAQCCESSPPLLQQICPTSHCAYLIFGIAMAAIFVSICVMGVLCIFCRRRRTARMQAAQRVAPQVVVDPYLAAHALQQLRGTLLPMTAESLEKSAECPVCLETTPCQKDTWLTLPCSHGLCSSCFGNLARYELCSAACPLCRKTLLGDAAPPVSARPQLPTARTRRFLPFAQHQAGRRSRMVTVEAPAIAQQAQPPSLPLAGSIPMPSNEVPALTSGAILTPSPGIPPEVLSSRLGRSQAVVAQSPAHSVSRLAAPAFTAVTMDGPCMTTQHGLQQSSVQPANRSSQDDSPTRNPLHSAQQGQAPQHNPVLSVQLRHQHGAPQQAADDWVP